MQLFRVFDWDGSSAGNAPGGPLFVARRLQGAGRHDAPDKYGAWYCSRDLVSAVAESIKFARGQVLEDSDFVSAGGTVRTLIELRLDEAVRLVDLDDPRELVTRRIRPSQVATGRRPVTQGIASAIFDEGATGFTWRSTLEAEWSNVTLFHERALRHVSIVAPPTRLSSRLPEVKAAADRLGIRI